MIIDKVDVEYLNTYDDQIKLEENQKLELLKNIDEEINKLESTISSLEKELDDLGLGDLRKNMLLQELNAVSNFDYTNY